MATTKHKFLKIVFNPANQKLVDLLDELQKLAKNAFGISAHAIIGQFMYAKMPQQLKKSLNQAQLGNRHIKTSGHFCLTTACKKDLCAGVTDGYALQSMQKH